jgi:hypothetical protein
VLRERGRARSAGRAEPTSHDDTVALTTTFCPELRTLGLAEEVVA